MSKCPNVIGKSKKMLELFDLVESVASSEANILIQGENGTGKELFATAIHDNSRRSGGPFIKINCAAIPKDLIESELFGYRKGAFTGAMIDKQGLFELAEGGSLLLDEVGEMPPYLQTKLLRVLQEREYRPIGGDRLVHVDFRLICATNVDVAAALRDGRIREDLYFRINTITLRVPPLREHPEDIPLLCEHFLEKLRERYQKNVKTLAPSVYHVLMRNRWPGNIRELENALERAMLVAKDAEIAVEDLPDAIRDESTHSTDFVIPPHRTLAEIQKLNLKAGVVLNPATPVHVLDEVLDMVDYVLLMSVNPGFGGQHFLPQVLHKVKALAARRKNGHHRYAIEIDGGIDLSNVPDAVAAGVDWLVAGTSVFGSPDPAASVQKMQQLARQATLQQA